jgi:hypothetical protein
VRLDVGGNSITFYGHSASVAILHQKKEVMMSTIGAVVEKHHKLIIVILGIVILFFVVACIFDDAIPVCHWLFKCDHGYHG